MNNSEKLLSNFAEKYFTDELVIAKLHYTPEGGSELELADLIINLEIYFHLCNVYVFRLLLICKEEKSITFEGTNVPVGKSNKYSTSDGLILKL